MIKKDLATYSNLEIVHFDSIDNALETIKLSPPLLILTEGRVGDKTALQLLETVKTDKNYRSIPIVVHSRAIRSELKSAALRIGAHAVFHNPRDHKNLKIALTKLLKSAMDEGVTADSDNSIRNKLKK
jgi:DNA-binding NtrC family response regulator